jgi:hypothetical protein
MMATDTLNGLWVGRLVRSADRRAASASRIMSVAVALVALAIAGIAAARRLMPGLAAGLDGWDTALGVAVVATVACAYAVALRITREARWTSA